MQSYTLNDVDFDIEGRRFADEGASIRALVRVEDKIKAGGDVSVYRYKVLEETLDRGKGDWLIAVVGPPAEVAKLVGRVTIAGEPAAFGDDEMEEIVMRHLRLAIKGPDVTRIRHGSDGALALVDQDGNVPPRRRPRG